jgi:OOP family OmpA-OmpF porin
MRSPLLVIAACAVFAFSVAQAKEAPGQWYVSPMISAIWADSSRFVNDDFGAQAVLGHAFENWNLELSGFYYDLGGANDSTIWGVGLDATHVWYRERRVSAFGLVGYGYTEDDQTIYSDTQNDYANAGLGLLIDLSQKSSVALRAEVRYRLDFQNPTQNDWIGNVGVQIPFGGNKEVVAMEEPDSDGDGVRDEFDKCPGTPAGVKVDSIGCPLDSDGDSVPDYMDKCPGTPANTMVDASGCPVVQDSDGDGVVNSEDECPNTPPGVRVDSTGCEIKKVTALEGVGFATNSDELTPGSKEVLDKTAAELARYPDMKVEVAGHTSSTGPAEYNQVLSERRARAVADYLISTGLAADRFTVKGYGESDPVADNGTAEGRARNRRVELRILN